MAREHFELIDEFIEWMLSDGGFKTLQAALVGTSTNVDEIEDAFEKDIDTISIYGPYELESREQVCFYARLARKKGLKAPIPSEEVLTALMSAQPYKALREIKPKADS